LRLGTADFDRCRCFPAPPQPSVHDLPDGPPSRAVPGVTNHSSITTGAIALAAIAADLDAHQLTALALVLLVTKTNDLQPRDR
jgi:hypothetical protein